MEAEEQKIARAVLSQESLNKLRRLAALQEPPVTMQTYLDALIAKAWKKHERRGTTSTHS